jgi:hypothetical protein
MRPGRIHDQPIKDRTRTSHPNWRREPFLVSKPYLSGQLRAVLRAISIVERGKRDALHRSVQPSSGRPTEHAPADGEPRPSRYRDGPDGRRGEYRCASYD